MRDATNGPTLGDSGTETTDGYLYILVNQYVPSLVKIGYTDRDPHVRATELSGTTGVPGQWVVRHYWLLENAFQWEQRIFLALRKHRETGEFFKISAETAIGRIELLLLQAGAIDASGMSAAGRRELARQDAARKREEQRLIDQQQEQIAEQDRQRQFDTAWEQGWPSHVQPWCKLVHFCGEQMKTYSRPGLLHKMINGTIDVDISVTKCLVHILGWERRSFPSTQKVAREINELIPHLRKWHGYPRLLALLPEMFTASRRAREFILHLNSQYGRRTPSGWGGNGPCCKRSQYWNGGEWYEKPDITFLYGMPETWPALEIRLATQKVFGLSGDEATALLQSEPAMRTTLMNLATNSLPPESQYGKDCVPYV
ncbi:MAG: hypothetical protein A3F74_06440 [Betaproteobacteria bacterium RIFCSPLOWO2_12_FULL_62_58]|nr:MAG: hypothetical protein A3F74_06440 [Betaproteobacteria bacterium RIFCSPLOWO2_12_FULL_62_58]